MSKAIRVLVASRSQVALDALKKQCSLIGGATVTGRLLVNGSSDPLDGATSLPDVLVLWVPEDGVDEIAAYVRRAGGFRCPLIMVSAAAHPPIMRLAMQAGARDFLTEPVSHKDLETAIHQIMAGTKSQARSGRSVAFINASGGCGATFLAASTAHLLRASSGYETALVDLDMLFSPVAHYVDVTPKLGLTQALMVAKELDETALRGYLTPHASGLQVMAAGLESEKADRVVGAEQLDLIINLMTATFEYVVFDVPNQLDGLGVLALERADHVVVVLQQSLPSLRNAVRLISALRSELGIPNIRVTALVNRFRKGAGVDMPDITQALQGIRVLCVPNHYRVVAESIALGVPLYEHARNSPVITALRELEERLGGRSAPQRKGLFTKTLGSIMGN
jgi:pilus assembly protein CpaE